MEFGVNFITTIFYLQGVILKSLKLWSGKHMYHCTWLSGTDDVFPCAYQSDCSLFFIALGEDEAQLCWFLRGKTCGRVTFRATTLAWRSQFKTMKVKCTLLLSSCTNPGEAFLWGEFTKGEKCIQNSDNNGRWYFILQEETSRTLHLTAVSYVFIGLVFFPFISQYHAHLWMHVIPLDVWWPLKNLRPIKTI